MTEEPNAPSKVVAMRPSRMPIAPQLAREFDVTPDQWRVIVEQIFPSARTVEAIGMALSYCRARNLDIFKKPVHIVPMWSSALRRMVETVWPGIAEIRTTAARTGEYAGIDAVVFGEMKKEKFTGQVERSEYGAGGTKTSEKLEKTVKFPEWASVIVYRIVKGQRCPFNAIVYWEEAYATIGKTEVPNDMWEHRPRGQLAKCVEAAALRMAFPEEVGSMYAAEEMEGRVIEGDVKPAVVPERPTPPSPPPAPEEEPQATEQPETENGRPEPSDEAGGAVLDTDAYLQRLDEELSAGETREQVDAIFDEANPQIALIDTTEAVMKAAFGLRAKHYKRVDDAESPALPLETKIAQTP